MALSHVNAVIVGAGAGGGVVAKELAEAGLSRGAARARRMADAMRARRRRTDLPAHHGAGQRLRPGRRALPPRSSDAAGSTRIVLPSEGGYNNNAACVGAGTVSYGAMAWRFMAKDFRMRTTYGAPEGSTLEDWPITYDDLEPFYEKAEWEIGVSGDDRTNPFTPPPPQGPTRCRRFPYNTRRAAARAGRQAAGAASVPHPDAAQLGALQRPAGVHAHAATAWASPAR